MQFSSTAEFVLFYKSVWLVHLITIS